MKWEVRESKATFLDTTIIQIYYDDDIRGSFTIRNEDERKEWEAQFGRIIRQDNSRDSKTS